MLSILACFLWVGLAFAGFGDDVMIDASELNDVALNDRNLLETIKEYTDPDIIIGTETWLTQLLDQAKYSLTTIYMI
jgi:hypothetical protein